MPWSNWYAFRSDKLKQNINDTAIVCTHHDRQQLFLLRIENVVLCLMNCPPDLGWLGGSGLWMSLADDLMRIKLSLLSCSRYLVLFSFLEMHTL